MDNQNIADLVRSHLQEFGSKYAEINARTMDHLVAQQEKLAQSHEKLAQESIGQDKRIDRLELLVESVLKRMEKQSDDISKVLNTINEIALNQSNIDHDRRRFGEDIEAIDRKLNKWQEDCTSKYNDANKEIIKLQDKVKQVYWTAGTISGVAVFVGWIITTVLKAMKVL